MEASPNIRRFLDFCQHQKIAAKKKTPTGAYGVTLKNFYF